MKKVFITFIFFITVIFFHAACMGQGNKSDINVIFIGNSITQGVLMEQPEKNAPPVRCAQYLANAPGIGNVEIFNAGLSGRTTVDFLPGDNPLFTRIADGAENLRVRHPQALTLFSIMLGTNDSAGSGPNGSPVSDGDYKKNISLIVDLCGHAFRVLFLSFIARSGTVQTLITERYISKRDNDASRDTTIAFLMWLTVIEALIRTMCSWETLLPTIISATITKKRWLPKTANQGSFTCIRIRPAP